MNSRSKISVLKEQPSIQYYISHFAFMAFLFFIFFGTKMPFRDFVDDVQDISTSNQMNQIVFGLLFLTASFSISDKISELMILIKKEKFLFLLLAWCLISIFWSDFKFESSKAFFLTLTSTLVCVAFLLHLKSSDKMINIFKLILGTYLVISFISILTIPGAIDPKSGTWRGLADGKNVFGQVTLLNFILWFSFFKNDKSSIKYLSLFMTFLSIILLFGSRSMTCILIFFIVVSLDLLFSIDKIFQRLNIGRSYSILVILLVIGMIISTLLIIPDIKNIFFDFIGKDSSFTGRTDLWSDIFDEAKNVFPIGCGYAGFWVVKNLNLLYLYETYVWLPYQAHNGYLDLLNETGLIGLIIIILMVSFFFKNMSKIKLTNNWHWIVFAVLILNLQESALFRARHIAGTMFIVAYLIGYVEYIRLQLNEA